MRRLLMPCSGFAIFFRVFDRETAKDLVLEAFCRAWTHVASVQEINTLKAFLYRVAHNIIADDFS
jgi:DNA-directed RNA polymerase specialized sigma24 family protein